MNDDGGTRGSEVENTTRKGASLAGARVWFADARIEGLRAREVVSSTLDHCKEAHVRCAVSA